MALLPLATGCDSNGSDGTPPVDLPAGTFEAELSGDVSQEMSGDALLRVLPEEEGGGLLLTLRTARSATDTADLGLFFRSARARIPETDAYTIGPTSGQSGDFTPRVRFGLQLSSAGAPLQTLVDTLAGAEGTIEITNGRSEEAALAGRFTLRGKAVEAVVISPTGSTPAPEIEITGSFVALSENASRP